MSTTHVFIVDSTTFKYHLEYLFVGTGAKDEYIDFNNNSFTELHSKKETNLLAMMADIQRVRKGDHVIFYLQQNSKEEIHEGKFYGVFKIKENLSFLDNNDENQYLKEYLRKSLTFRAIIEPEQVYADGITEWEALDEIKNIQSPNQMLWSLIYRKLKGNRGNTMITLYESERLIDLIRKKNLRCILSGTNFSFDKKTQKIINIEKVNKYKGRKEKINILPRLISKYNKGNKFEAHLQTYILQNINNINIFKNYDIEWLGNEVSCGVGMQRIDIMLSISDKNRKVIPIELKSTCAYPGIINQIQRYLDWLEQYYIPNRPSDMEPMIISRKISDKTKDDYKKFVDSLNSFNNENNKLSLKIRYVEFEIINDEIKFTEVKY